MTSLIFQIQMDQATDCLPHIHAMHSWWCMCVQLYTWEHVWAPLALNGVCHDHPVLHSNSQSVTSGSLWCLLWCSFHWPGMWLDPSKVQALHALPDPDWQTKLQSFLGLINYLQPFIPGLSNKTAFLWEQLSQWDWNPSTDSAFQHLKPGSVRPSSRLLWLTMTGPNLL